MIDTRWDEALVLLARRGMVGADAETSLGAALQRDGWGGIDFFIEDTSELPSPFRYHLACRTFGMDGARAVLLLAADR